MRRLRVELGAHGPVETCEIARRLDNRDLHAETDAEVGNAVHAGKTDRANLALDATVSESARHHDAVHGFEHASARLLDVARFDEVNVDPGPRMNSAVLQRFDQRDIGILEIHVLAHHRDVDLARRMLLGLDDLIPLAEVRRWQVEAELTGDDFVEALFLENPRNLVEIVGIVSGNYCLFRDIREQCNLLSLI